MKVTGPVLLLLSVVYFAALAPYGLNLDDEGTLLYQIYRTYSGQQLYVDFHAGYTPGIFYWNAALFWIFGLNVLWVRLGLALVNGLSVYCLYLLARQLGTSRGAAATAGLLYLAFIPFYAGQFASFNIPYPIWYVTLFWLLSVLCALRRFRGGTEWWWLVAGLCAGVTFFFKPNSGLLNLAGLLIALCAEPARHADASLASGSAARLLSAVEGIVRWLIPISLLAALTLVLGGGAGTSTHEVAIFCLPLMVITAAAMLRASRRPAPVGLLRDLVLLAVGFALVTLPWLIPIWKQLGTDAFLRTILFVGTNFDRFYFMRFPDLGRIDLGLAAAFAALWFVAVVARRRIVPPSLMLSAGAIAALAAVAFLWLRPPPMVEGFQASVVSRFRAQSFGFILVIEWTAILIWFLRHRSQGARQGSEGFALGTVDVGLTTVLVSAILMHFQLYPRTDFMHLVPACPGALVLLAWLLDRLAREWARGFARARHRRGAVRLLVMAPVYALILVLIAPALGRIDYLARAAVGGKREALAHLDVPHAPLVVESSAGRPFAEIGATVRYLRRHTGPDDRVFTFPALDLICFLAERQNPTRHGYFYPGWPGHDVEAEVIDTLSRNPPRYIVALHDSALYFIAAPFYYFNLRQYVVGEFAPVARFGMFDVLSLKDGGGSGRDAGGTDEATAATVIEPATWVAELRLERGDTAKRLEAALGDVPPDDAAALAAVLAKSDTAVQRLAADLIRSSRSPMGAAALARLLAEPLDPTVHELFVRVVSDVGTLRAVAPLLRSLKNPDLAVYGPAAGIAFLIVSRSRLEDYWWAPARPPLPPEVASELPSDLLIEWIRDQFAIAPLRAFAIQIAGLLGDQATVPALESVVASADESASLRFDAVYSLIELGRGADQMRAIARMRNDNNGLLPALLAGLYGSNPDLAFRIVSESMQSPNGDLRTSAYWIAAASGDARFAWRLNRGLRDPNAEVRAASQWAKKRSENEVQAAASAPVARSVEVSRENK